MCREVGAPYDIWQEVTAQGAIEAEVICRNMRHLEQTAREGGVTQTEFYAGSAEQLRSQQDISCSAGWDA